MNKLTLELSSIISQRKDEYYCCLAKQLNNPQTNANTYGSILKTLFNDRKILVIPPILINGKLVSDFKGEANRFNEDFTCQCTFLNNESECFFAIFAINERFSSILLTILPRIC